MTDKQIRYMVNRFLGWKLPEDFRPDAGVSFKKTYNDSTAWPWGTNLLNARQAEAMVCHMIDGMPKP